MFLASKECEALMKWCSYAVNAYGAAVKVLADRHGASLRLAHQTARIVTQTCESAKQDLLAHQEAHGCGLPQIKNDRAISASLGGFHNRRW